MRGCQTKFTKMWFIHEFFAPSLLSTPGTLDSMWVFGLSGGGMIGHRHCPNPNCVSGGGRYGGSAKGGWGSKNEGQFVRGYMHFSELFWHF